MLLFVSSPDVGLDRALHTHATSERHTAQLSRPWISSSDLVLFGPRLAAALFGRLAAPGSVVSSRVLEVPAVPRLHAEARRDLQGVPGEGARVRDPLRLVRPRRKRLRRVLWRAAVARATVTREWLGRPSHSTPRHHLSFPGEYFGEQPWLALPFAERDAKEALSKKFKVRRSSGDGFWGGCWSRIRRGVDFHLGHGIPTARAPRREQGAPGWDGVQTGCDVCVCSRCAGSRRLVILDADGV